MTAYQIRVTNPRQNFSRDRRGAPIIRGCHTRVAAAMAAIVSFDGLVSPKAIAPHIIVEDTPTGARATVRYTKHSDDDWKFGVGEELVVEVCRVDEPPAEPPYWMNIDDTVESFLEAWSPQYAALVFELATEVAERCQRAAAASASVLVDDTMLHSRATICTTDGRRLLDWKIDIMLATDRGGLTMLRKGEYTIYVHDDDFAVGRGADRLSESVANIIEALDLVDADERQARAGEAA
jgi:hypothetical protein